MTHDNFSSSLQDLVARQLRHAPHEPQYIANEMLRRDRWRTRILAFLSLLFWLAGTAGMMVLVYGLNRFIIFMRISGAFPRSPAFHAGAATQPDAIRLNEASRDLSDWGTLFIHHSMPYVGGSIIALLLAALFTVMLIFSSRQATLNRINISLMQLSEQLRLLREEARTKT